MRIICEICAELCDETKDVVSTRCGHIFHETCIKEWLKYSRTCPKCRNPVEEAHTTRLFFSTLASETKSSEYLKNEVRDVKSILRKNKEVLVHEKNLEIIKRQTAEAEVKSRTFEIELRAMRQEEAAMRQEEAAMRMEGATMRMQEAAMRRKEAAMRQAGAAMRQAGAAMRQAGAVMRLAKPAMRLEERVNLNAPSILSDHSMLSNICRRSYNTYVCTRSRNSFIRRDAEFSRLSEMPGTSSMEISTHSGRISATIREPEDWEVIYASSVDQNGPK